MEPTHVFLVFSVLALFCGAACRAPMPTQEVDDDGMVVVPQPSPEPTTPSTQTPAVRDDIIRVDPSTPIEEEDPIEYTSEVYLNANCDMNLDSMVVVAGHSEPALCEHIIALAICESEGDTYDIGRWFDWTNDASSDIALTCTGLGNNHCGVMGTHDLFDMADGQEPSAFVMACTNNDCLENTPDCQPIVCRSITMYSVVNLEGSWVSSWAAVPDGEPLTFTQDARNFEDAIANTKHGVIYGSHVTFDMGDYLFEGDLSSNRLEVHGNVTELMTDTSVGSWTMTRIVP